nr:hypothetical protein [Angustibacter aerolatus]
MPLCRTRLVALYDPQVPADAEPRVVGSATRSRVRAENLPHAATAVLLRDGDGLGAGVYVHRRTDTKDVWPGRWDCFAGGVVGAGEPAGRRRRARARRGARRPRRAAAPSRPLLVPGRVVAPPGARVRRRPSGRCRGAAPAGGGRRGRVAHSRRACAPCSRPTPRSYPTAAWPPSGC